jgi:hypothetical protein
MAELVKYLAEFSNVFVLMVSLAPTVRHAIFNAHFLAKMVVFASL